MCARMDITTIVQEGEAGGYAIKLLGELTQKGATETATILTLAGDLGAGKTTLVQALARELGITEVVTSPTFVIMKFYETTNSVFTNLIHIDAYRILDVSELAALNFSNVLQSPHTLVCIEWPERIQSALPKQSNALSLEVKADGSRTIIYHGY